MSADRIVEAARELTVTSQRLPSIRSIAAHLDVDPMAIYYYFSSKQALLEAMASSIMTSVYQPKTLKTWENELSKLAVSYVDTLRAYPGLLEAMLASPVVGPVVMFSRRFNTAIGKLSLEEKTQREALYLFIDYLHGFVYSATCANESTGEVKTKEVVKPLRLLFAGMQLDSANRTKEY